MVQPKGPGPEVWQYLAECGQILCWSFFKPYTFNNWLQGIDSDLSMTASPFLLQAKFENNPQLKRYAFQVWWLALVMPSLISVLVGCVYSLTAPEPFYWQRSSLVLIGWSLGLLLVRQPTEKLSDQFTQILWIWFIVSILLNLGGRVFPDTIEPISTAILGSQLIPVAVGVAGGVAVGVAGGVALGVALGVAGGVAGGVALGVALGVAVGVALGVALGVAVGVALGVALGVAVGVALGVAGGVALGVAGGVAVGVAVGVAGGVALGVAGGVALGVALGVAGGVAVGVAVILGVLRIYFWVPELLWTLALKFLVPGPQRVAILCYLPPYFDELIHLPLPFLSDLIAEAHQHNPTAARQTLNHFTNFTNQQRTVARSLFKIALAQCGQCQTFGDLTALVTTLDWLPSPPPREFGLVLPQFLEISQSLGAAQAGSSPYRQVEFLRQGQRNLENLQSQLALGRRAREATQFGGILQRWQQIVNTQIQGLEAAARQSQEIPQVYIAGPALDPATATARFKGRQDLFREIETLALAAHPPVLLLYGGRRTGKTSTLRYLPQKLGADLVPLLVDLQGTASASTLAGVAYNLALQMQRSAREARNLELPEVELAAFQLDPFMALQAWMDRLERSIPHKRVLLCLDEFERLERLVAETQSHAPLNFLRHILQHRGRWILLFSGAHTLAECQPYWSDYLINTRSLRLTYLPEADARDLILHPVTEFPPGVYSAGAVAEILHQSHAQPYLVQLLCMEVVEFLNQHKRTQATAADVQGLVPVVLERGETYFHEFWHASLANDDQRQVLGHLLAHQPLDPALESVCQKLVQKEIVDGATGQVRVPLIATYIRRLNS
jgi:AAA+ ATPase superfamily predicted ATPase